MAPSPTLNGNVLAPRRAWSARSWSRIVAPAWTALFLVSPSWAARSEFSPKDAQVLGRTMGFVGDGMTGGAVGGGGFAADAPAARREADAVRAVVGDELPTGRVKLRTRLVPVDQLSTVNGIDALFITSNMAGSTALIAGAAQRLRIPTLSTDMANCVVGFSSQPTVQIVIDRGAADRAGVRFMQAFRMLVREK